MPQDMMYETEEIQQEAKEEKACQAGSTECRSMGVTNSSACLELIMVLYENGCWKLKVKGSIAREIRVGCHSHPAAAVLGTGAPAPVLQAEGSLLPPRRLHLSGRRGFSHREAPGSWRLLRKKPRIEPLPWASLPRSQWGVGLAEGLAGQPDAQDRPACWRRC